MLHKCLSRYCYLFATINFSRYFCLLENKMYFIKNLLVCSSVLVSYLWCLETKFKIFQKTSENTDIDAPALATHVVSTVTSCGLMCNSDARCKSFTLCENCDNIVCRLFDKVDWTNTERKSKQSCSYYEEEGRYCGKVK